MAKVTCALPQNITSEVFRAKVVMICNELHIPPATMEHMQISRLTDYISRNLIMGIKTYITVSGEETVSCNVRWPADWWEALKDRWLPRWAMKYVPIYYNTHRIERTFYRAVCPHIEIPYNQGKEVHFAFLKAHDGR